MVLSVCGCREVNRGNGQQKRRGGGGGGAVGLSRVRSKEAFVSRGDRWRVWTVG